ncbi:hypothetical protein KM043_015969 [Ampulex compressa]|nr:hypothetical protein KM043_015969 [Ampulex compressa]
MLKISGLKGNVKAATLVAKITGARTGTGVRIAQLSKKVEVCLRGLDNSITPQEEVTAMAAMRVHGGRNLNRGDGHHLDTMLTRSSQKVATAAEAATLVYLSGRSSRPGRSDASSMLIPVCPWAQAAPV